MNSAVSTVVRTIDLGESDHDKRVKRNRCFGIEIGIGIFLGQKEPAEFRKSWYLISRISRVYSKPKKRAQCIIFQEVLGNKGLIFVTEFSRRLL